jgi:hypothetical protein
LNPFPTWCCENLVAKDTSIDTLRALAMDVLAQSEARQRVARRLEEATVRLARPSSAVSGPATLREHVHEIRRIDETERGLLDEYERHLARLETT